ncbi:MAG: 3-isopropylmalate dehydratase large subunit [Synergistaceae bacterium]|nr:3-isopropylmalate dehydratase large subunit [Synergistaceae bacterium]
MGMTMAEKVLAGHSGLNCVTPGQIVMACVDRVRINDGFGKLLERNLDELGVKRLWDADRIILPIEHQVPPSTIGDAEDYAACRRLAKRYGLRFFYDIGRHGICHVLFVEEGFARPGELVAATDSHTCTYGALNCAARGIGPDDLMYAIIYGKLWFKVPESIKIIIDGRLPDGVYSKDIVLYLAGKYGSDMARYCSIEFAGSTVRDMSLEARLTISNMGIELGAKFALFEADDKVIDYLKSRTDETFHPVISDPDAKFKEVIEVNAGELEPYVACPHDLSNSKPLLEVFGTKIDQAFLGSCTNCRIEDLRVAASILRGRRIADHARLIVNPASMNIYRQAMREGLFEIFMDAGAIIDGPTCGPCAGGGKGVLASGERCISTTNRNFCGRMGSPKSEVYLASPATVAASAISGSIADPRAYLQV